MSQRAWHTSFHASASQWTGLAIALAWGALQLLDLTYELGVFSIFVHGWMLAVYAALICGSPIPPTRVGLVGAAAVGLGMTHFLWVFPLTFLIVSLNNWLNAGTVIWIDEIACMYLSTGLAFAIPIGCISANKTPLAIVLGCTLCAFLFATFASSGYIWDMGMPLLLLHVGIGASLFVGAALEAKSADGNTCPSCGYALKGLPANSVCPECGNPPRTDKP